jgi:2-phosphoglycolate phosphatase
MLEAVFFDLDGTLLDTAPDFDVVLNRLLTEQQRPNVPLDQVRSHVSHGARALVRLGYGLEPEDEYFDEHLNQLLDAYEQHLDVHTVLFPGMQGVLNELAEKNIPWGVVTNKPVRFTKPILEGLGLIETCGSIICPDHVAERKPAPEGLFIACNDVGGVQPENCIYVGDHERDILAGKNAGMKTVAAMYGYIDEKDAPDQWQADFYIDDASSLIPLIQEALKS